MDKTNEQFNVPLLRIDTKSKEANVVPKLYQDLINKSKQLNNIEGALYLAAETMPFEVVSENYKYVSYDKDGKNLVKSLITKPIIYNHEDGSEGGGLFGGDPVGKPEIAGRILASQVHTGAAGTNSIFTGQMITDKDAIDRIMSMLDYNQSISFFPKGYICDVCGLDAYDENCNHRVGAILEGKQAKSSKKDGRVVWKAIPEYAAELSFVLIPAYRDASIKAYEQNSIGNNRNTMLSYSSYTPKSSIVVPESAALQNLNGSPLDTNSKIKENSDIIKNKNKEEDNMDEKVLEQLTNALSDISKHLEKNTKVLEGLTPKPNGDADKNSASSDTNSVLISTELTAIKNAITKIGDGINSLIEGQTKAEESATSLKDEFAKVIAGFTSEDKSDEQKKAEEEASKKAEEEAKAKAAAETDKNGKDNEDNEKSTIERKLNVGSFFKKPF